MVECQKEVLELRDEVKQAMGHGFEALVEKKLNRIKPYDSYQTIGSYKKASRLAVRINRLHSGTKFWWLDHARLAPMTRGGSMSSAALLPPNKKMTPSRGVWGVLLPRALQRLPCFWPLKSNHATWESGRWHVPRWLDKL